MNGKAKLMLIEPVENLPAMAELSYAQGLQNPADFAGEVPRVEVNPAEVKPLQPPTCWTGCA